MSVSDEILDIMPSTRKPAQNKYERLFAKLFGLCSLKLFPNFSRVQCLKRLRLGQGLSIWNFSSFSLAAHSFELVICALFH